MTGDRTGWRGYSVLLAFLAAAGTLGAAAPGGPDERPTPTRGEAAASVRAYDLGGSVKAWDVRGSVSGLQVATQRGTQTVITLKSDILFDFASARLSPVAVGRIGQLTAGVPRSATVTVTGYTDAIGSDVANVALSARRASAVGAAVTARRPDLVLDVAGHGEAAPVAPNSLGGRDNPDGRAKNRRVEIGYHR